MSEEKTKKAELALEHSKQYLESTLRASDSLENKAFVLLGICVTLINAIIGYFIHLYLEKPGTFPEHPLLFAYITTYLICLIVSALLFAATIWASEHAFVGNTPASFLDEEAADDTYFEAVEAEARSYTSRIGDNLGEVKKKGYMLASGIMILISAPILPAFAWCVLNCLSSLAFWAGDLFRALFWLAR